MGFTTARLAAQRGHHVSIVDVSSGGLRGAEAALSDEGHACATAVADIADSAAIESAVTRLSGALPITAVVNAAALLRTDRSFVPFADLTPADIEAAVQVNVLGVLNTVRAVFPQMLADGSGVVVNIGSIAAAYPASGLAAYALTKAAVRSLTGTLAAEVGRRGVHVQGLAPGVVQTGLSQQTPSTYLTSLVDSSVRGSPASADEVAQAAMAIIESPNPAQAGHMVAIDGGLSPYGVLSG